VIKQLYKVQTKPIPVPDVVSDFVAKQKLSPQSTQKS
jgi:hypothetical protein